MKLVTPTGIEPMSPPWKGDVLTAWPRGQKISDENLRLVSYPRLERGTTWLKVKCSTTWANSPNPYCLTRLLLYITLLFLSCQHFFKFFLFFFKKCFIILFLNTLLLLFLESFLLYLSMWILEFVYFLVLKGILKFLSFFLYHNMQSFHPL